MNYLLSCSCGRQHTVTRSQAGQKIECECGNMLQVPTLRELTNLPSADSGEDSPPPQARDGKTAWQGWRGPAIALASAGLIISLAYCGWFSLQRSLINTSYTADSEIAAGNELFDLYDPEELSLVWESYEVAGLRTKHPPEFYLWNRYAETRQRYALVSGSLAGVFAVIVVAIWWSARVRPTKQRV